MRSTASPGPPPPTCSSGNAQRGRCPPPGEGRAVEAPSLTDRRLTEECRRRHLSSSIRFASSPTKLLRSDAISPGKDELSGYARLSCMEGLSLWRPTPLRDPLVNLCSFTQVEPPRLTSLDLRWLTGRESPRFLATSRLCARSTSNQWEVIRPSSIS